MDDPEIDPERAAEIVAQFREMAKSRPRSEAAQEVGARYGLTADEVLDLERD
jgi:hypothetical protein